MITLNPLRADEIKEGDRVVIAPYNDNNPKARKVTVVKKITKTGQISLENGERFTNNLQHIGSPTYRAPSLERYDANYEAQLLAAHEARIAHYKAARSVAALPFDRLSTDMLQRWLAEAQAAINADHG